MKPNQDREQKPAPLQDEDSRDAMRPDRSEHRSTRPGDGAAQTTRPSDDDVEADEELNDVLDAEDARQDPKAGALNAGERRQGSDDAMRRDRGQTSSENAGQQFDKSGTNRNPTRSAKRQG